ncbi:MAG: hypothetical protein GY822_30215 [Deltaproteobacteria bacterium]|nr:hypothetical protein [Deltaproteobacteria bacterium]
MPVRRIPRPNVHSSGAQLPPSKTLSAESSGAAHLQIGRNSCAKVSAGKVVDTAQTEGSDVMDVSKRSNVASSFKSDLLCDQMPKNAASSTRGVQLSALQSAPLGQIVASIDLGSSSAKMLVQRLHVDGRVETLSDLKIGCALGKNVGNGSAIPQENQERTKDALRTLLDEAARFGVSPENVPLITTAVMRNATNGSDFLAVLQGDLGISRARILSGDDEAAIGFRGAISAFTKDAAQDAHFASIDLGGGSFQMAVGTPAGVEEGASTQVGSNHILDNLLTDYKGYDDAIATFKDADFSRTDAALAK